MSKIYQMAPPLAVVFLGMGVFLTASGAIAQVEISPVEPSSLSTEQTDLEVEPKRSYIGIGGNVGLGGNESALSDGGFVIVTRTRIIDYLSLRGSFIISDDTASATALTGEIPIANTEGTVKAIPFLGGGISISDGDISPLLSAGVDVPLSQDFTLTNRVNVSFSDNDTDVGTLVGVGYNFNLF